MKRFCIGLMLGLLLGTTVGAFAITPARILDGDSKTSEPTYLWGWGVYTIHGEFVCADRKC